MTQCTRIIVEAALSADKTVRSDDRNRALALLAGEPIEQHPSLPPIYSRREVARLLGKTPKRVDQIAAAGFLKRVPVPGGRRALGFDAASVQALLEGRAEQAGQEVAG